jgi:hypothetical protein
MCVVRWVFVGKTCHPSISVVVTCRSRIGAPGPAVDGIRTADTVRKFLRRTSAKYPSQNYGQEGPVNHHGPVIGFQTYCILLEVNVSKLDDPAIAAIVMRPTDHDSFSRHVILNPSEPGQILGDKFLCHRRLRIKFSGLSRRQLGTCKIDIESGLRQDDGIEIGRKSGSLKGLVLCRRNIE